MGSSPPRRNGRQAAVIYTDKPLCAGENDLCTGGWFHCRRRQNERYGIAHASLLKTKTVCGMRQICCLPFSLYRFTNGGECSGCDRGSLPLWLGEAGMPLLAMDPRGGGVVVGSCLA